MRSRTVLLCCLSAIGASGPLASNRGFTCDVEERRAYLDTVSEAKAAQGAHRDTGVATNSQSDKQNLKNVPRQAQVMAVGHCEEMYRVKTADGKVDEIPESNLRFKTDSGELGPRPGRPVIVRSGMRGDRALLVFARPSEISSFITEACAMSGDDDPF